jgi:hypothetical protein
MELYKWQMIKTLTSVNSTKREHKWILMAMWTRSRKLDRKSAMNW